MNTFLELALNNFWSFWGTVILLSIISTFIMNTINRILRHWNIHKHGYPPPHCDGDGDFLKQN